MSKPLTRPMSEFEFYRGHMEKAPADNPGKPQPIFATMRHTVVYDRQEDWEVPVKAAMRQFGQFENLFKNLRGPCGCGAACARLVRNLSSNSGWMA